jgi:hypothetical protein
MRFFAAVAILAITASPAFAQREPEIVIPGRPDVPVMINGVDASWGIVEGEFGLDRPGLVTPTVVYRPLQVSVPNSVPGYFPRDGRKPGYGRLEIVPPPGAPKPPPAPSYFRSWSSQSAPGPVTNYAPYPTPPIVYSPTIESNRNQRGPHHHHP